MMHQLPRLVVELGARPSGLRLLLGLHPLGSTIIQGTKKFEFACFNSIIEMDCWFGIKGYFLVLISRLVVVAWFNDGLDVIGSSIEQICIFFFSWKCLPQKTFVLIL